MKIQKYGIPDGLWKLARLKWEQYQIPIQAGATLLSLVALCAVCFRATPVQAPQVVLYGNTAEREIIRAQAVSITPITSVAAGSSGLAFSGDAYEIKCTTDAAAGTLYPAVHDGTAWTVYLGYPFTWDGTITKISAIFPAKRASGLTWNAFKSGAATLSACTAEQYFSQVPISRGSGPTSAAASVTLTAGAGLTGGGDLSANRTFDVGAGTGITVNANDVALTVPVTAANGGTGNTSYAVGDLIYASGATTLSKLADVAAGSYLRAGGVTTAPVWSTATLPNTATTGDLLYASASNVYSNLAASTSGYVLTANGAGAAPSWQAAASAYNYSPVDYIGPNVISAAGNYTLGTGFAALLSGVNATGIKFYHPSAGTSNIKATIYDATDNSADATVTGDVTGTGNKTLTFASPLTLTVGKEYRAGIWETTSTNHFRAASTAYSYHYPSSTFRHAAGKLVYGPSNYYVAGDGSPTNVDATQAYAIEVVIQ